MASTAIYPPLLLSLPLQISHRLPPSLQSVDPQVALVTHVFLSLFASIFTIHPAYLLPLSLFGLISSHPALTSLLPHFLALWVVSIGMDMAWLLRKSADANLLVTAAVGASMVLKLPSAAAVAQVVRSEGYIQEDGGATGFAGLGGGRGVSLPGGGLWSGTGAAGGDREAVPGAYNSVYADEEGDEDAQEVHHQHGKPPAAAGRGGYSSIA
ncbi:hypothetical protein BDZ90DRAFT_230886 [Jaminaea rosea]|uniref:Uncharacterized protein n=1 Tax=Jaminaea rosea TaxID=1569628 RepID=A0A316UVQ7_9BASI|nr:hypothetical protein BDZ90DRAFT_230886 [Jaminaea rosea]PWN28878.1 hypothetical protein BDZ90DRAFT_230886 [Jaminaea rosea]